MADTEYLDRVCHLHYGCTMSDLYISVPHQLPPQLWDATKHPPEQDDDDQYVKGDHDWNMVVPLLDGPSYKGHQWVKVQSLAERVLKEIRSELVFGRGTRPLEGCVLPEEDTDG
jgi:hypothetical protein